MIVAADPVDADALRIRHEFLILPERRLSVEDAARLLDLPVRHARAILDSMAAEGFLERDAGVYSRRTLGQ